MLTTIKKISSTRPLLFRIIVLALLITNIILVAQSFLLNSFGLNIFYYIAFNFILLFFLLITVSLFLLADGINRNDTELQDQLRMHRFRISIISGLFSALSIVALMKGISQSEGLWGNQANDIALFEISNVATLFGVFILFFLYGIFVYYMMLIFFGAIFRIMFWSSK